jgi:hypothetical protein
MQNYLSFFSANNTKSSINTMYHASLMSNVSHYHNIHKLNKLPLLLLFISISFQGMGNHSFSKNSSKKNRLNILLVGPYARGMQFFNELLNKN